MTTKELLKRIGQGDEQAFEDLYNAYGKWLFNVTNELVRDRELAEEIVEDVFFKLWQFRKRFDEIRNFESYIYVCAKNLSYDHIRKRGKREFVEINESMLKGIQLPADSYYEAKELKELIEISVMNLPEKCKIIFQLVRVQQLSYKEAADQLKLSPKTIENQLRIATRKIIDDLGEHLDLPRSLIG
ncbi:MAG: RNA polymerase sigma-70 factor (family 1) [Cyclobacteriaceae bacterium]|jgi:RNA polymerase sigma-70 factor (ECF subfamily)